MFDLLLNRLITIKLNYPFVGLWIVMHKFMRCDINIIAGGSIIVKKQTIVNNKMILRQKGTLRSYETTQCINKSE